MKAYLQRLVERSLHDVAKNTLLPNPRQWGELIDPFENSIIVPLATPVSTERLMRDSSNPQTKVIDKNNRPAIQSATIKEAAKEGKSLKAVKRKKVRPKDVSRQRVINETTRQDSPNIHTAKAGQGRCFEKVLEVKEVYKKTAGQYQVETKPHLQKPGPGLQIVRRLRDYQERINQIATGNNKPKPGPIAHEMGRVNQASIIPKPLLPDQIKKKRISAIQRPSKKQNSSQQKPRLVIGRLSVDVIPVGQQKHRLKTKAIHKRKRTNASQINSGQAIKNKFGIGQM